MQSLIETYCSPEWQHFISFHKQPLEFKENETIFEQGQKVKGIYFITKGKVKVISNHGAADQKLVRLASNGDILGHRGLGGDWVYPISCVTLVPTSLCFIPIDSFNDMAKSCAEFSYALSMFFVQELKASEIKDQHQSVKYRVLRALLDSYETFGFSKDTPCQLSFTLTHKDLASQAGTTYETLVRTLSELKKSDFIKIENKDISIPSITKLYKLCEESKK